MIQLIDVCLPDYFSGYHKPVLQVPVDGSTTKEELIDAILNEYNMVWDHLSFENAWPEDEEELKKSIYNDLFKEGLTGDAIVFPDLDERPEDDEDDELIDSVYAFFIWEK